MEDKSKEINHLKPDSPSNSKEKNDIRQTDTERLASSIDKINEIPYFVTKDIFS